MKLINPKRLSLGDTIGIISPSSSLATLFPHRIEKGRLMLEKLGFRVVFGKHALQRNVSAQDRASDIHEMFADKRVNAVICTIGGLHANKVLKYLDFTIIQRTPKIFVGYSDITTLHYALAKFASLRTFYGPCLMSEFGEYPEILSYTRKYFQTALLSADPIGEVPPSRTKSDEFLDWAKKKDQERPRKLYASKGYLWWRKGKITAPIIGGAVPTINNLAGTKYWIDPTGMIFFIDIPEGELGKPYSLELLDVYFANFDNLNIFASVQGLIIGIPPHYGQPEIRRLKEMIAYYTEAFNYPILFNVNIGHVAPIITLPLFSKVCLDAEKNKFEILTAGVE